VVAGDQREIMVRAYDYELQSRRHEPGLFLCPTMPNAILYTNNYISIGLATNFSTANFLLFNCILSIICSKLKRYDPVA